MFEWFINKFRKVPLPRMERSDYISDVEEDEKIENSSPSLETENPNSETNPQDPMAMENSLLSTEVSAVDALETFMNTNMEKTGYVDCLVNWDSSHMEMNKDIIKTELGKKIADAISFYEDHVKDFQLHIKTRTQSGLMDVVDELQSEQNKINEKISALKSLATDLKNNVAKFTILLTYERGFKRGLAALTADKLLGKKLDNG